MNSTAPFNPGRSLWLLGSLMVLSSAAFAVGLSDAPIERAEIYFLDAARAMVERGDWLVPFYRGEPFYDKPPLTYWLLALSFDVFGASLFAGRLMAALLALATLRATYHFATLVTPAEDGRSAEDSRSAAFFATAILGTSYAFVSFARLTMSDMLLTLLTLLAGSVYLRSETESRPRLLVGVGALLGLGFLAKGPIAWIYFGALLLAFVLVERRLPKIFNPAGLLGTILATGVGFSWFFLVYLREGIEPLKWFFLRENLQRFAAPTYDAAEPLWFYLPIYAVEGLPWSVLAIPALLYTFRAEAPKVLRILLGWSVLMLAPLSLSRGKLDYYLLPILPPLGIVIGAYLALGRPRMGTLRILAVVAGVLLVGAAFFPMLPAPFSPSLPLVMFMRGFLGLGALACFLSTVRPTARALVALCATMVLGAALFLFGAIVPAYRSAQPTEAFLDDIARERVFTPNLEIAVCEDTLRLQRDILFTLRIPVVEQCELWAVVSSSRKFLIIATSAQETSLRTAEHVRHIATRDHLPADVTRLGTLLEGAKVSPVALLANFTTTDPVARWKENREWKRWLDTPEGQKAQAEYEEEQRHREEKRSPPRK
ncbi:MAG: glycosyltransferase family 39 protein [Vicinamibacteria bacterium]|nr:glycosyltransferase family 39 protein [Vicinamibacteria bacterium]